MSRSELAWRSLHDLGLASWFGGSVFGSVALPHPRPGAAWNGESTWVDATELGGKKARLARMAAEQAVTSVEDTAWKRWTPVVAASMAAHLVGGAGLLWWNRGRVAAQDGVAGSTLAKTALTAAAVGLTVAAGIDGARASTVRERQDVAADGESVDVPGGVGGDRAQRSLRRRQRIVGALLPATTGALVILSALHGEQQRPREMAGGVLSRASEALASVTA